MKVAAVQFKAKKPATPAAQKQLGRLIATAGEHGAELIVCPEMALTHYLFPDAEAAFAVAEPAEGGSLPMLGKLAARFGSYVVCGYLERAAAEGNDKPRLYNSARVIAPDGQLLINYRKRLLYDADMTWALPGDTPYPLFDTPFGSLTVGICMDLNDDRFTQFLVEKAPHIVAFCTNWLYEGSDVLPYWRHRLAGARSYFVAANTYGWESATGHPLTCFCGRSAILSPDGEVVGCAPFEGDALVLADIPRQVVAK